MPSGEVRVTDPDTGGQKGQKVERFDLLPVGPLTEVARHYGRGAEKYEDRNWERGYDWSLSYAALMRHVTQFWNGEDVDPETGSHHLAAVVFHAFALMEFGETHPEKDNRPTQEREDAAERGILPSATVYPIFDRGRIALGQRLQVKRYNIGTRSWEWWQGEYSAFDASKDDTFELRVGAESVWFGRTGDLWRVVE